jgi:diguanylate cyclase (GGDEF)-like protein
VARFGGEEFVVVLPGTGLEAAVIVAERLRSFVSRIRVEGLTWPVTASFGVAEWHAQDSVERLISRADHAMYAAKAAGRDRVVSEK